MFSTPVSSTTRMLAKAGLAAGLLTATMVAAPAGTASAGEAPGERPLTIGTRCEGSLPIATVSVLNAGLPELFFNVLENGTGILDDRLVARDGTQVESVAYPATGPGTEYSIETEEGYEVGRATLTDPEPDCTDGGITIEQRPVCADGTDLLEVAIANDGASEAVVDLVADTEVVRDDVVVAPGAAATVTMDWPRTTTVDPLLEVFDNDGVRQGAQDLLSGSVTPCGDDTVPEDTTPEDTTPEPTDVRVVVEAAPAVVVAGAPNYTG